MALDPSIPLQVRAFKMPDPVENYTRGLQLQGMSLANEQAQRNYQMELDTEEAFKQAGGDTARAYQLLSERGLYKPAQALQTQMTAQQKAALDMEHRRGQITAQRTPGAVQEVLLALQDPSDATITGIASRYRDQPGVRELESQLLSNPDPAARRDMLTRTLLAMPGGREALTAMLPKAQAIGADIKQMNPLAPGYLGNVGEVSEQPGVAANRPITIGPNGPQVNETYVQAQERIRRAGAPSLTVNTGPMTPGKTAANQVDESMLNTSRNLMRLETISNQFKPEYQKFADKVNFERLRIKDKTFGLNNKERADLSEYSTYRRNAFDSLNEYIKSITGAAMTNAEADRILKGLPNPGDGLFNGDSPAEFQAKLDDALKQTKMAVARLAYIKRSGMSLDDGRGNAVVPLASMPTLMRERGKEIEAELKRAQPNADARSIQSAVRRQLGTEFGLASD